MKRRIIQIFLVLTLFVQPFCINANAQGASIWITTDVEFYIRDVAKEFDLSPYLLEALVYEESRMIVMDNLTQITSKKWFREGLEYCGSDDITNPYVNIRCCGYYLHKWAEEYPGEPHLWLRMWNEGYENALDNPDGTSGYSRRVIKYAEELEEGGKYRDGI